MTPRTPITGEEVADVLERAADLIEPEGKWTQGFLAVDAHGEEVEPDSAEAKCFCAMGAIDSVIGPNYNDVLQWKARAALRRLLPVHFISSWNDAPERTQAEVVAALRSAATAARQQEQSHEA